MMHFSIGLSRLHSWKVSFFLLFSTVLLVDEVIPTDFVAMGFSGLPIASQTDQTPNIFVAQDGWTTTK